MFFNLKNKQKDNSYKVKQLPIIIKIFKLCFYLILKNIIFKIHEQILFFLIIFYFIIYMEEIISIFFLISRINHAHWKWKTTSWNRRKWLEVEISCASRFSLKARQVGRRIWRLIASSSILLLHRQCMSSSTLQPNKPSTSHLLLLVPNWTHLLKVIFFN